MWVLLHSITSDWTHCWATYVNVFGYDIHIITIMRHCYEYDQSIMINMQGVSNSEGNCGSICSKRGSRPSKVNIQRSSKDSPRINIRRSSNVSNYIFIITMSSNFQIFIIIGWRHFSWVRASTVIITIISIIVVLSSSPIIIIMLIVQGRWVAKDGRGFGLQRDGGERAELPHLHLKDHSRWQQQQYKN